MIALVNPETAQHCLNGDRDHVGGREHQLPAGPPPLGETGTCQGALQKARRTAQTSDESSLKNLNRTSPNRDQTARRPANWTDQ